MNFFRYRILSTILVTVIFAGKKKNFEVKNIKILLAINYTTIKIKWISHIIY
jgi:hypothetical protein